MADPNARDTKLIQYLNGGVRQGARARDGASGPYRDDHEGAVQRLQQHLRETKGHAREVERRIKQLGGKAEAGPISALVVRRGRPG